MAISWKEARFPPSEINRNSLRIPVVSEETGAKTLKDWLEDEPELLEEVRKWYEEKPEWWGIDPDKDLVFFRTKADVDAIRKLPGEKPGHHPHGLALGGPCGQTLTHTGDTKKSKNPIHSEVGGLQTRVLNVIKRKMGI